MAHALAELPGAPGGIAALERGTRIRAIETAIILAPTVRRHKLSNTEVMHREFVLVRARLENGVEGIGEAAVLGGPRWAEESVESIKAVIDHYIAPALAGLPASRPEAAAAAMSRAAARNYSAKAGVDSAIHDALGRTLDLPVHVLLGGAVRERFSVIWALASGNAEQELEEALSKLALREMRRFKIKLGFATPAEDLRRLRTLRGGLPAEAELIVDVNQAWSEADCLRFLPALGELGVTLIEQPLPADDLEAMARVAARSSIPLMVDEAGFTCKEIARAGRMGCGSVYSLKLVKSGGLRELKRAAAVAEASGMALYGGCLLESSIGAAAHLAAFATLPRLPWGTEQFGPRILVDDVVTEGLQFEDFEVLLPEGPGLGVTLDEDRLRSFARPA
jgi:muconate cycloisomerase